MLEYEGKYQAWTAYKEAVGSGANAFKVGSYYHIDWMEEIALPLRLDRLTTDQVYENFVWQITGDAFAGLGETLKESVEWDERRRKELQKQIVVLQVKRQLNKQVRLKRLKKELEAIK